MPWGSANGRGGPRFRSARQFLATPGLLLVVATALVSGTAVSMFRPLVAPYASSLGADALIASGVVAAAAAPGLLLAVPVGSAAQRFGERWVLIGGGAAMAASGLLVAVVHALPALAVGMLLIGTAVVSNGVAAQGMATAPVASGSVDTRRVAAFGSSLTVGQMAGPAVGGVLSDAGGYPAAFWGVAALGLATMLLGTRATSIRPTSAAEDASSGADARPVDGTGETASSGGSYRRAMLVLRTPLVPTAITLSSLGTLLNILRHSFLPLQLDQIGWSASAIGVLLSGSAVVALLARAAFPMVERRLRLSVMFAGSLWISAAGLALAVITRSVPAIVVGTALATALLGMVNPITLTMLSRMVSDYQRQLTLGVRLTARHLTQLLGPVVFGGIAGVSSVPAAFVALAALAGVGASVGTRRLGRPR